MTLPSEKLVASFDVGFGDTNMMIIVGSLKVGREGLWSDAPCRSNDGV